MNWVITTIIEVLAISLVLNLIILGIFKLTHKADEDEEG